MEDEMTGRPGTPRVYERAPGPALRPFLRRFLVVEFPSLHHDTHLPNTGPVAAFSFRGGCRIDGTGGGVRPAPTAAFTGLHDTLRTHEHDSGHSVLIATFTPAGAASFLRPPLEEFTGTTADLAGILGTPAELGLLHERLADSEDHATRVALLEGFLLARLRAPAPDPLVAGVVARLERGAGSERIADLARDAGLSQSALERRFRRIVGVSPKRFAGLARLGKAVRLRAAGAGSAAAAHAAGYYDQSHFLRDFRRATGGAPDAYYRRSRRDP